MTTKADTPQLKKKDFESDQQVRWCPGCGDYAILSNVQTAFASFGVPKENIVVISGIGCAARFPYYVDSYGFHTIHGRAPAIATGLKIARPELSVWVVGGDGDMLSIGGNHLLHACRRNVDINILVINNEIYGLTKGQYSPTSKVGTKKASTPMGSIDRPVNPIALALAAEATFVARSVDRFGPHLQASLKAAQAHQGSSFVEIMQNCVIFNDGTFDNVTGRGADGPNRPVTTLELKHGEPLRFGRENELGIRLNGIKPEVVKLGENGVTEDDLLVYDKTDASLAYLIAGLDPNVFPTPIGVFYDAPPADSYEASVHGQIAEAREKQGEGDLMALLQSGDIWTVE
ncbi:MAG: 2-oxoacid:ferredoxin oxidoreductase subunit beta [Planctomycetota bacterium]|jgi:2-oxoglutarate ferredoxin oxidoreductase subunit beta